MIDEALIDRLLKASETLLSGRPFPNISGLLLDAIEGLERSGASLAACETRREALEAENTFLREEISAAAQRQKALAPRENEAGEGL